MIAAIPMSFAKEIYQDAKLRFPEGTIETRISRREGAPIGSFEPDVWLIHIPTGTNVLCHEFPTQNENFVAAVIRLRIACDALASQGR